jgi:hypothetical protein
MIIVNSQNRNFSSVLLFDLFIYITTTSLSMIKIKDGEVNRECRNAKESEEIHRGLTEVICQHSVEGNEENLRNIWFRIAAVTAWLRIWTFPIKTAQRYLLYSHCHSIVTIFPTDRVICRTNPRLFSCIYKPVTYVLALDLFLISTDYE